MKRSTTARPAVLLGCATVLCLALGACGDSDATIIVGVAAPLEQALGVHTLRGAQLARDQINAAGGLRGKTLELLVVSDSADPRRAVGVAEEFLTDPRVVAVMGHSNSGAVLATAPIYERGLVAVSATATSPEISEAGEWIFRISPSDAVSAAGLARFALQRLGRRAVTFYANDAFGRGLRQAFGSAYTAGGGMLPGEYPYIEGETTDFEPFLLGARGARPDLIFVAGLDDGAARIIRQARELGLDAPVLGGDGLLGLVGRDSIFDGTYVLLFYHPATPDSANREFVAAYQAAFGVAPDAWAALAYDATMLIAQAIEEVGADREKIRRYLDRVGSERDAFMGVSGEIGFDENGDPREKDVKVGRIAGPGIELVSPEDGT
ncbi:MAG: ABC transporter substrate-binding protein [Gemmatimonadetes bacterium]|uniref:ABC transporter substrate-binding protein n=1 Tax=Candidatus Kutchimonas denitrificans TaxID=3056748 RepID=A0AAE4Z6T3_9BACT|nr:ABC transporter substrate-binding protein [Gemmatimonadota bacterium]NIR74068.1 ABC transporter substrate-binding protein [Candidatus Kutchimonas denitrificans]NIS01630.1 ABC transporter substrate-binding protein [Gemmatimonadota bacterium]NIT67368.1 ABC transporter substrate-binding protein [Gemmatimonadota bacterium]NIU52731.1 ABC transporter substrate-binding protein [Gemmatimonadota bacterium]